MKWFKVIALLCSVQNCTSAAITSYSTPLFPIDLETLTQDKQKHRQNVQEERIRQQENAIRKEVAEEFIAVCPRDSLFEAAMALVTGIALATGDTAGEQFAKEFARDESLRVRLRRIRHQDVYSLYDTEERNLGINALYLLAQRLSARKFAAECKKINSLLISICEKKEAEDLFWFLVHKKMGLQATGFFGERLINVVASIPSRVEMLQKLIGLHAVKVNQKAVLNAKETALHSAARYRNLGALQLLLAAGANPFLKNDYGYSPLGLVGIRRDGWDSVTEPPYQECCEVLKNGMRNYKEQQQKKLGTKIKNMMRLN